MADNAVPNLELEFKWKRPVEVAMPNVWHNFVTRPKNLKSHKVKIQDIPEDRFHEVGEFISKYYITEEPLCVSSNLVSDVESLQIFQHILFSSILPHRHSIMAVLDDGTESPPMIGLMLLTIATKEDTQLPQIPTDSLGKMIRMYGDIRTGHNPFEILQSETMIHDWGLCVHPNYRGMNVGYNILYSLQHIARAFNIPGTMIMFTRTESQVLADRLGFKVYNEIVYGEYKDENGDIIFPVVGTKSLKFMGRKYT